MKTKITLAAILAALMLGACSDPLSDPAGEAPVPAEGGEHTVIFPAESNKALVLLSVNGAPSASRVVLPDFTGTTYSYRWYAEAEDPAAVAEPLIRGDFTPQVESPLAIELEPARWTLAVRAWTGEAPAEDAADPPAPAFAGRTELALAAGAAQPLTIGLLPNGEGRGTFSYNVSLPDVTPGYAFISVFPLDGGAAVDVIDLKSNQTGTRTLTSGYYHITTAVNYKDGSTQKFAAKREVLYIYEGLTSSYAVTFGTEDFCPLIDYYTVCPDLRQQTFDMTLSYLKGYYIWFTTSSSGEYLENTLAALPQNTPDTPYLFALKGYTLDGTSYSVTGRLGNKVDPLEDLFAVTQGRYVFYDLRDCTGTVIPDIESYIANYMQHYKDRVTGIILPDQVTLIGMYTFSGCSSLAYVGLPSGLKSIKDSTFKDCTSLTFVDLPSRLTTINQYVFDGCSSLASIDLPSSLTLLQRGAFRGCASLASIDVPQGITKIGDYLFNGCASLKSITLRRTTMVTGPADDSALEGVPITAEDFHIYVPSSLVATYKGDAAWRSSLGDGINRIIRAIP